MKFIGGTHHNRDAPMWVKQLVLGGATTIDIEEFHEASSWVPNASAPNGKTYRVETYRVERWHSPGHDDITFLAIAGKDRDYIESLARPVLTGRRR